MHLVTEGPEAGAHDATVAGDGEKQSMEGR